MQVHILKIYKALRCELDGSRVTVKTKWTLPQTYIFVASGGFGSGGRSSSGVG